MDNNASIHPVPQSFEDSLQKSSHNDYLPPFFSFEFDILPKYMISSYPMPQITKGVKRLGARPGLQLPYAICEFTFLDNQIVGDNKGVDMDDRERDSGA